MRSLIKNTLEMQGFRIDFVEISTKSIEIWLMPDGRYSARCGKCGEKGRVRDKRDVRRFRHVPVWGIPVEIVYAPRRVGCRRCGGIRVEKMPWATGKRRFTKGMLSVLAEWSRKVSWKTVGEMFGCSWGLVAEAAVEAVEYGRGHQNLDEVRYIGIDEISRRRGHVYVTNVYDLGNSRLLWSGEGRTRETLQKFFKWFGGERAARLKGVCCDMCDAYANVARQEAPDARIVFDKFHIAQHLSKAVDQTRRDEINEKGAEYREALKGTRYIWLKRPENLTENQQVRLSGLVVLNSKITRAYLLKESFAEFWNQRTRKKAGEFLKQWFWQATHSRLKHLRDFAWMLRRRQEDILNYFELGIANAASEGMNNKARVITQRAYGFRTAKTLITNLYHTMGKLPLPETLHRFV